MINEMVQKVHPGLHGPLMGLTTMMMAVQEQLPSLLQGKPVTEPSTLVHEMFVRYANGTKTDADLSLISKGLDEIFTHEYTADDAAKAIDLVNAKDLFADAGPKPQLFPNTTIPFQAPPVKVWPNMNATMGLKPNTYTPTNLTFVAGKKDQAIKAKYNDTIAGVTQWRIQQAAWDKVGGGGRRAGEGEVVPSRSRPHPLPPFHLAVGQVDRRPRPQPDQGDWRQVDLQQGALHGAQGGRRLPSQESLGQAARRPLCVAERD